MSELCQRRIVWATVADKNGTYKDHPVVVTTEDSELELYDEIGGIGCSHSAHSRTPWPDTWVELPCQAQGLCGTKLKKPTMAICEWGVKVHKRSILSYAGLVSHSLFDLILEKIELVSQRRADAARQQRAGRRRRFPPFPPPATQS